MAAALQGGSASPADIHGHRGLSIKRAFFYSGWWPSQQGGAGGSPGGYCSGGYCRGDALSIAMAGWLPKTALSIAMVGRLAASEETPTTGGLGGGVQGGHGIPYRNPKESPTENP